ncbi:MAG: hypothetical protein L0213_01540 [Candidatus Dadabacteria bacterium]|nr:hypothetical protein [Candidatus Dadabacteria bacterium]
MTEYLAVGFPLVTGAVLAAFFPISLKDYFVEGEIQKLGHGLTPYKFRVRHYIYIFVIYILSAVFLSLVQAYLLWDLASDKGFRIVYRVTDYFLYPVFPSALMAVLLMLFVFSYLYARRGEDDVRKFLLRTYDGWPLYREIPRYKPVALAAGIMCAAVNLWIYNIYIGVSDTGLVYSTPYSLDAEIVEFDDVAFLVVYEHPAVGDREEKDSYSLRLVTKGLNVLITRNSLLQSKNTLKIIDNIIREYDAASGKHTDVVMVREGLDNWQLVWGTFDRDRE